MPQPLSPPVAPSGWLRLIQTVGVGFPRSPRARQERIHLWLIRASFVVQHRWASTTVHGEWFHNASYRPRPWWPPRLNWLGGGFQPTPFCHQGKRRAYHCHTQQLPCLPLATGDDCVKKAGLSCRTQRPGGGHANPRRMSLGSGRRPQFVTRLI